MWYTIDCEGTFSLRESLAVLLEPGDVFDFRALRVNPIRDSLPAELASPIQKVLGRLHNVQRSQAGWMARCPSNATLAFLLSDAFPGSLHPEHCADARKSGLSDETMRLQRIRSVPPAMIGRLLGFDLPSIRSAMLIPFPDPAGGFMDHIRLKIFPPLKNEDGHSIKYLQPKHSGVRLFFPLATLARVLGANTPLWLVEGEKKSLAVAQLGLPAVGVCGIEGWHVTGSRSPLADFDVLHLQDRIVELAVDGDVDTNPQVEGATRRLADALRARGGRPRLVQLPVAA